MNQANAVYQATVETSRPERAAYRSISSAGAGWPGGLGGGGDGGVGHAQRAAVHHQQAQVGQRVAERGHLPVEDRPDLVALAADQDVVEAVVAVHDRRGGGAGQLPAEGGVQLVDAGQVAVARGVELLGPAAQLAVQEALGAAEVREAHLGGVHGVQPDQGVDQVQHGGAGALGPEGGELLGGAERGAVHELHHVEGRPQHLLVLAQEYRARHGHVGRVQRVDDAVLASHVVRGGQDVAERRASYDPAVGAVRDGVGEVRPSALDQPAGQRAAHQAGPLAVEQDAQPVEIESGRVVGAHRLSLGRVNSTRHMMPTGRYAVQWAGGT
ncbi:hypothetical protein RKD37_006964 [Streptomyces ambofaciens]